MLTSNVSRFLTLSAWIPDVVGRIPDDVSQDQEIS
jgi:hypothetical protein